MLGRGLGKMVPCLKVSLMSAENKEEMACSGSKSHVPVHDVRAPSPARVVENRFPFLPAQQMRPVRGDGFLPELMCIREVRGR
jgi:hypothetical protein